MKEFISIGDIVELRIDRGNLLCKGCQGIVTGIDIDSRNHRTFHVDFWHDSIPIEKRIKPCQIHKSKTNNGLWKVPSNYPNVYLIDETTVKKVQRIYEPVINLLEYKNKKERLKNSHRSRRKTVKKIWGKGSFALFNSRTDTPLGYKRIFLNLYWLVDSSLVQPVQSLSKDQQSYTQELTDQEWKTIDELFKKNKILKEE